MTQRTAIIVLDLMDGFLFDRDNIFIGGGGGVNKILFKLVLARRVLFNDILVYFYIQPSIVFSPDFIKRVKSSLLFTIHALYRFLSHT